MTLLDYIFAVEFARWIRLANTPPHHLWRKQKGKVKR